MNVQLPKGFITSEQFIGYCENKCENQAAFFTTAEITAMMQLADVEPGSKLPEGSVYKMQDDMIVLCRAARYRLSNQYKKAGRPFDQRLFRHLMLVTNKR